LTVAASLRWGRPLLRLRQCALVAAHLPLAVLDLLLQVCGAGSLRVAAPLLSLQLLAESLFGRLVVGEAMPVRAVERRAVRLAFVEPLGGHREHDSARGA